MKVKGSKSEDPVSSREDRELARRMARGDDKAFRTFFDDYYPRVYRFCIRRLEDAAAEDVAQTVITKGIRKIATYRGEASLLTWLTQIARNEIRAHYRSSARFRLEVAVEDNEAVRAELESIAADPALNPEPAAEYSQRQHAVQLILDHLPGQYGTLLEWKYIESLSVEEMAERLETTAVAVQSKLARARAAFAQQYESLSKEMQQVLRLPGERETGR